MHTARNVKLYTDEVEDAALRAARAAMQANLDSDLERLAKIRADTDDLERRIHRAQIDLGRLQPRRAELIEFVDVEGTVHRYEATRVNVSLQAASVPAGRPAFDGAA